jgi:hypothetical protein
MNSLSLAIALIVVAARAADVDRFNYYETTPRDDGGVDFGPAEWALLDCQGGSNIENCVSSPRNFVVCALNLFDFFLIVKCCSIVCFESWDILTSGRWVEDGKWMVILANGVRKEQPIPTAGDIINHQLICNATVE